MGTLQGGAAHSYAFSNPTFINCILWGDTAPDGAEIAITSAESPSSLTISYSDVQEGEAAAYVESRCELNWGEGNIDTDPLFIGGGNYHLTADSPCIDAGTDTDIDIDIDGDTRPQLAGYDIGSDEFSAPNISLLPDSLTNSCQHGSDASCQSFEIWNSGGTSLNYLIVDDADWLYCDTASGSSTGEHDAVGVNYATSGLNVGHYTATITVSDPNSANSPQQIPVTLEVIPVPRISTTPESLMNSCDQGGNAPGQSFEVWNSGTGTLYYSITDNAEWLVCSPDNGASISEHDTITVTYNTALLEVGSYSATVTVSDTNAANSPQYVYVTLTVLPSELTHIALVYPTDASILSSPPTFDWTPNGGQVVMLSVDASLSPTFRTRWSTWENLQLELYDKFWTMPQSLWNRIPSGKRIYWRVRGVDWLYDPRTYITSDEVWSFYKQ
jgi:hypothetical protein